MYCICQKNSIEFIVKLVSNIDYLWPKVVISRSPPPRPSKNLSCVTVEKFIWLRVCVMPAVSAISSWFQKFFLVNCCCVVVVVVVARLRCCCAVVSICEKYLIIIARVVIVWLRFAKSKAPFNRPNKQSKNIT